MYWTVVSNFADSLAPPGRSGTSVGEISPDIEDALIYASCFFSPRKAFNEIA